MQVGDVVQFNENHKWCGCLGIIYEIKEIHNNSFKTEGNNDFRYMVGVPAPLQGTAYIYVMDHENAIELIGRAVLVPMFKDDE